MSAHDRTHGIVTRAETSAEEDLCRLRADGHFQNGSGLARGRGDSRVMGGGLRKTRRERRAGSYAFLEIHDDDLRRRHAENETA